MIFDTFSHADSYRHLSPQISRGFDWLASFAPTRPDGRYDLEGDNLFALVQSYSTVSPTEKKFESHRAYLDLQYVAVGQEDILYAAVPSLDAVTLYNQEQDFLLYADPPQITALHFHPGNFAIFFPQDGHKPGCASRETSAVKKVVIKVRL